MRGGSGPREGSSGRTMAVSAGERPIGSAGWGAGTRPLRDQLRRAVPRPAVPRLAPPPRARWVVRYLAAGAGTLLLNLVLQWIALRLLGLPLWLGTAAA